MEIGIHDTSCRYFGSHALFDSMVRRDAVSQSQCFYVFFFPGLPCFSHLASANYSRPRINARVGSSDDGCPATIKMRV